MRYKIIILVLVVSFSKSVIAQMEWAPIGAEWNYSQYLEGSNPLQISNLNIESESDTVISNLTIRKLRNVFTTSIGDINSSSILSFMEGNKVYINKIGSTSEFEIIYNFNLGIGDSIETYFRDVDEHILFTIDSVGTKEINGNPFKVWFLKDNCYNYGPQIIENIGSIEGLIPSTCLFSGEISTIELNCYEDNSISYENVVDCDFWGTISSNQDIKSADILMFPNPFTQKIQISSGSDLLIEEISILNSVGLPVFNSIERFSQKSFSLSHLPNGLFFVLLRIDETMEVFRIIKQ